jgi:hypothetical protein
MFPAGLPVGPFGRAWVPEEDAFLLAHASVMTAEEIARHVTRDAGDVRARLSELGVVPAAPASGVRLRVAALVRGAA